MESRATLMERLPTVMCVVFTVGLCVGSSNCSRRLVCWQAILKCHREPECRYAYDQYLYACASVISGERNKCPSHCISSLIHLNLTQSGPALEDCDCTADPLCRSTKQAIEPCLPRTRTMGCTEARRQCEKDPPCQLAMTDYLSHCRKLFGGQRCSEDCRRVIASMRALPKAQQLDTCVCDGTERNICEYIKVSMKTFCSDPADRTAGSGFSDDEEDSDDDDDVDLDDYLENSGDRARCQTVVNVATAVLLLNTFV
ncbi:growth arrest-specific protein 1b [Thalassophryne amazonica]|uniref:growth arrest-specific protein 1b n=1 Tax=Thalassophryne amazonica TaxID=390379 RepID=UPI00147153F0|nr:growth arrest-specific protein 1b [Thalassophryne amazonica]